jgi:hypothetical protein
MDFPANRASMGSQGRIWVHCYRSPDQGEHGHVVGRIRIRSASNEFQALPFSESANGLCLGFPMQWCADESSGVDTVFDLAHGTERSGEAKSLGNDGCQFDWGGSNEPHPLPAVEMALS